MSRYSSQRLSRLGSAIFSEMNEWKDEVRSSGLNIIDLGIGSPDLPPSPHIRKALEKAIADPGNYAYPTSSGMSAFRNTVTRWYAHRFQVELDADHEVVTLMGSQDGLAHLSLAITDPGDLALIPDPGYPIYEAGLVLAGVRSYFLPLKQENGFLPVLEEIPEEIARDAKFILCNYPSNPVAAVADLRFFEKLVSFARQYELLIVHDLAYSEMAFDGFIPPSILQVEGAKELAVEFHSLSKSFNMAGCRIAFMVGNANVVRSLQTLKSNIDYGVFEAVQHAGIAALEEDMKGGRQVSLHYQRRRDIMVDGLASAGWKVPSPKATMFIWAPIPNGWTSRQISREILYSTGVVVIPGDAFGQEGEGYVRIALVQSEDKLLEAAAKLKPFIDKQRERGCWNFT